MSQDICALDPNFAAKDPQGKLLWFDIGRLMVEGRGWTDTEQAYDRLPARAKAIVRPPVWELGHHSAGIAARFVSNATSISARWTLRFESLAMHHMPSTGVSGLDLYVKIDGRWQWTAVGVPWHFPHNAAQLLDGISPEPREYLLYLPLYNGVTSVEIGVPPGATLAPAPPRSAQSAKPICFYGTSIVHGGCASRPGMAYTAIVSRRLDRPHINLGFSGNGPMDLEMADLLAEIDPCVYVLDPVPNMSPQQVSERVGPFVRKLRAARPRTPIVIVECINLQDSVLVPSRRHHAVANPLLRAEFEKLTAARVPNLHYVPCDRLLGDDWEATVDGIHPTDLGFARMADALLPVLERVLGALR